MFVYNNALCVIYHVGIQYPYMIFTCDKRIIYETASDHVICDMWRVNLPA